MSAPDEHAAVLTVPALLSVATVATVLGCSTRTVRRRISAGALPAVVEGERTMVRGDDLRTYVDSLKSIGARNERPHPRPRVRRTYDFLA